MTTKRPKILTWHVHGSYLRYLTHAECEFYVPVTDIKEAGYAGKPNDTKWRSNLHELPVDTVKETDFDCILFQSPQNYLVDQYTILTPEQRDLPKIYLEHDPPREHPTDTRHVVSDPSVLVVDVTHFNNLMWDHGGTPSTVIEHGVALQHPVSYTGTKEKGIVIVNNIVSRGRRLGYDIFEQVRAEVPLDIIGMGSEAIGGLGEVHHSQLPEFISEYRFFFNPIRYTSLGLSIIEAMMVGMPIVGLATTELVTVIKNGENGYIDTDINQLITHMHELLANKELAHSLGKAAQATARETFSISRFAEDWTTLFRAVIESRSLSAYRATALSTEYPQGVVTL